MQFNHSVLIYYTKNYFSISTILELKKLIIEFESGVGFFLLS